MPVFLRPVEEQKGLTNVSPFFVGERMMKSSASAASFQVRCVSPTVERQILMDEIRYTSGPNPRPYVVVTPERIARVAAHLKERLSPLPFYQRMEKRDLQCWDRLAWGCPMLNV